MRRTTGGAQAAALVVVLVSGCGAPTHRDDSDRHFQECLDAGGDYTDGGNDDLSWKCDLPDPVATPTDEPS